MSTEFNLDFGEGDPIEVGQVAQYAQTINELESGQAFYRADAGAEADLYVVDFSDSAHNGIEALSDGQIITFKAANANTGPSSLFVSGTGSTLPSCPITKHGGDDLEEGDILEGQMIMVIYNSVDDGRFEIIGR